MSLYKKKLFLSLSLLVVIAVVFWAGSRYPQLDAKAMMGVDSPTMGISFDVVKQVESGHSALEKIAYNTLNWMDTNKKGMTFGFLFGAGFILLFSLIKDATLKNRFLNTALGAIVGAPLGVCVNCAAPIAKGMKDAGAKTETALATMITSPTLNVIVLSMLFSFLPPYMVWLKIGFTLLFIFVVIPLVSSLFKEKEKILSAPKPNKVPAFNLESDVSDKLLPSNWYNAFLWTLKSYAKSLWFIVKTTLPLMILAGILGNVFITFLPLEKIIDLVQNLSLVEKLLYMMGMAIFATVLPVPIAFDVIIVAILWSTGLHSRFAMVLLFCLGTYSIYSSFIVAKSFSFKLSVVLFLITALFGFAAGISGHFLERKFGLNYRLEHYQKLSKSDSEPKHLQFNSLNEKGVDYAVLKSEIESKDRGEKFYEANSIEIFQFLHNSKLKGQENKLVKIEGHKMGIKVPYHFSVNEIHDPFANQRSISTADVHNDGYPDLLVVSAEDVYLYANVNGKEFSHQYLPSFKSKSAYNAALVDFDKDGWKDLFVSTYRNGNYILKNDSGNFFDKNLIKLPQLSDHILTVAPAFGDINQDGLIDIVLGNWSLGLVGNANYTVPSSKNILLKNKGEFNFEINSLKGEDGETLSTLIADFTEDGKSDIIFANDFSVPDQYYVSTPKKGVVPKLVSNPKVLIEHSTLTTMSATAVDVNNDLVSEIFQVQIDRLYAVKSEDDPKKICAEIENKVERKNCEQLLELQQTFTHAVSTRNFMNCPDEYLYDCIAAEYLRAKGNQHSVGAGCEVFPDGWERYQFVCEFLEKNTTPYPNSKDDDFEHKLQGGLLLMKDSSGLFLDQTEKYNIRNTGWAWNSKFGDIDNDCWQDLLIANGFLLNVPQESNIFYKNIEGKNFEDKTSEFGLINNLPTSSYSYVDFDLDGDLDIVLVPSIGPIFIYKNNFHKNNSITFSIKDQKGNLNGIGTTVTIYYSDNKHQKREIMLSGGYKSFDETIAHFGLGAANKISQLKVKWSTGEESIIKQDFQAGYHYQINRKEFQSSPAMNEATSDS